MIKTCFSLIETAFLKNWLAYVWPVAALGCHLLAEVIWHGTTGASFEGECDELNDGSDPG